MGICKHKKPISCEDCMQQPQRPNPLQSDRIGATRSYIRPTRLVKIKGKNLRAVENMDAKGDIAIQSTAAMQTPDTATSPTIPLWSISNSSTDDPFDISNQHTERIRQLSGMMPAIRIAKRPPDEKPQPEATNGNVGALTIEDGWWPYGIQQTGALPIVNLYGREPFGRTPSQVSIAEAIALPIPEPEAKPQPAWKALLSTPAAKVTLGLLVGIGLLFLVARFVDIPATISVLKQRLTTPQGILLALLSGVAFLTAFSIRGVRWKLFLNPVGKVSTFKAIQLFLVGIFLNFLLPIRGGEVAKSLMLKRIANIPVSKSLPTVAMDKALDLMPALFIMAIVPFLGVQMDIKLWVVLALVGGLLLGLIFVPAVLLTIVAVLFDGLFAFLAFWTIGFPISFGTAIFGYTVYNMFYILPTPPGQVGSNEAIGLLVFTGLLHLPADKVTAMFVFSHPFAALLMTITGMGCLSALGLKLSSAMKVQTEGESAMVVEEKERQERKGLTLKG